MTPKTIGIVDYGVGNHLSVLRAFESLNYRCQVSFDQAVLSGCDILVLPGVGAFPAAMSALQTRGLVKFLQQKAQIGYPIIGLCVGMQLLAENSFEHVKTPGLGLIPGQVVTLGPACWHIGWNTIEVMNSDALLLPSNGEMVYFNHSFVFETPSQFQICTARTDRTFTVGVRHGNVVGLQFHPEKSQRTGRVILKNIVEGLISVK